MKKCVEILFEELDPRKFLLLFLQKKKGNF